MLKKLKEALKSVELTEEQVNKVVGLFGSESGLFLSSEENLDTRYSKLKAQKELLAEEVGKLKNVNDELSAKLNEGNVEELQNNLKAWEDKYNGLVEERESEHKELYLKDLVNELKGKDYKVISALLDMDNVKKGEDGAYTGGDSMLNEVKEHYPYLFGEDVVKEDPTPKLTTETNPQNELGAQESDPFAQALAERYNNVTKY